MDKRLKVFLGVFTIVFMLIFCIVAFPATTGRVWHGIQSHSTQLISKTISAAQNNYALLDPVAGRRYFIDKLKFSAATATYLYFNDTGTAGDVDYGWVYVANNGTFPDNNVNRLLDTAAGLYINCGGACKVEFEYHYE